MTYICLTCEAICYTKKSVWRWQEFCSIKCFKEKLYANI